MNGKVSTTKLYIMQTNVGLVKIGVSKVVESRLETLQIVSPFQVECSAVIHIKGSSSQVYKAESELHDIFRYYRKSFRNKFDGSTEYFAVTVDTVLGALHLIEGIVDVERFNPNIKEVSKKKFTTIQKTVYESNYPKYFESDYFSAYQIFYEDFILSCGKDIYVEGNSYKFKILGEVLSHSSPEEMLNMIHIQEKLEEFLSQLTIKGINFSYDGYSKALSIQMKGSYLDRIFFHVWDFKSGLCDVLKLEEVDTKLHKLMELSLI